MLINRKYLVAVPAVAFALLLIAGLVVSVLSLKAVPEKDWLELKDPQKILSGEATKRFTKLLNQHFVLGTTFNQIEHGMLWNLTGDWGASVRAGCGDWLFLTDELEVYPDRQKSAQFRASLAAKLNERLSERGIKLLMVVVPDKTRIESAQLCGLNRSVLFDKRVVNWLAVLQSNNVNYFNLNDILSNTQGDRYYHTDTHWNESGANIAAKAVASNLAERKWVAENGTAVTLNQARTERSGDLIHLAGLDGLPGFLRPKPELAQITVVPPIAVASDDLFGDAGMPTMALIGTSYSRNSNFVPFLEHHLGEQVANLARDGGAFSGAATAYFSGATFRDNPPKVVIWEVPERVIESPVTTDERNWLAQLLKSKL
jgi:alginate O-acetyltransferase complex protein AlgJ